MTAPTPNVEWYIARDGKQHGPLSEAEMQKLRELGHLRPTDLLWRQGFPDWRAVASVFPVQPPPPPPPAEPVMPPRPAPAAGTSSAMHAARTAEPRAEARATGTHDPRTAPDGRLHDPRANPVRPVAAAAPGPQQAAADSRPSDPQARDPQARDPRAAPGARPGPRPGSPIPAPGMAAGSAAHAPGPAQPGWPAPGARAPVAPRPGGAGGQHGVAPHSSPAAHAGRIAPAAQRHPDFEEFIEEDEAPPRRWGLRIAISIIALTILGGGGWLAYQNRELVSGYVTGLMAPKSASGSSKQSGRTQPAGATAEAESPTKPAAKTATAAPRPAPAPAAPLPPVGSAGGKLNVSPLKIGDNAAEVDNVLQQASVWRLIRAEFPDWYAQRLAEAQKMVTDKRGEGPVAKFLVESVVSLRRANADAALTASPQRLRLVASSFLDNLERMHRDNIDACYSFISQGEGSTSVLPMFFVPQYTEPLHRQVTAVFDAIAEGRKAPHSHLNPRKTDYDLLAKELSTRGWSEGDLKLFSDPQALARATPQRVCKMVRDWFAAQMAIQDQDAQVRLLYESLRPVVAG